MMGLVATTFDVDPVDRGVLATVATMVVIVGVVSRRSPEPSVTERALGVRPMVWLGERSYATYLWHWPLVVLLDRTFVIGPRLMVAVVALGATGLAHISMDLVERPIRRRSVRAGRREDAATILTALAATVLVGAVVVAVVLRADVAPLRAADRTGFVPGGTGASAPAAPVATTTAVTVDRPEAREPAPPPTEQIDDLPPPTASTSVVPSVALPVVPATIPVRTEELVPQPIPDDLGEIPFESAYSERDGCPNAVPDTIDECIVVGGDGDRVLLIGDSHAARLKVAFAEHAAVTGGAFAAFTMNGCAWQDGLMYVDALPVEAAKRFCRDQRDLLYDELVDEFRPDVVVLAGHDQTTDGFAVKSRPERFIAGDLSGLALIDTATRHTVDVLAVPGRRIVIIEPLPNSPFHALNCLSAAGLVDDCSFAVGDWPHLETGLFRQLAGERPDVTTVDMTTLACPNLPICRPIVDGVLVRTDADHLFEGYVQRIGPDLMGLIGPADQSM